VKAKGQSERQWALQHGLMKADIVTGIDPRVLKRIAPHTGSSHHVHAPDGTRLAYKRFGEGEHTLVFCNGLGGTYRTFSEVFAPLLSDYQIIVHDYRGLFESGASAVPGKLGVPTHADDVATVLDHAGVASATLFGWSMGVQVGLEVFRRHRSRLDALVLASGVDGRILDSVMDWPGLSIASRTFVSLMRTRGSRVSELLARSIQNRTIVSVARAMGLVGRNADVTMEHAALLFSADPETYWTLVQRMHEHDASDVPEQIDIPALILHGDADVLTPVRRGRELRARIRGAELWVFAGCTHAVILEYPQRVAVHVADFLRRRVYRCAADTRDERIAKASVA